MDDVTAYATALNVPPRAVAEELGMTKGVTVRERTVTQYKTKPRFYSDAEILDLFPDYSHSLVNALLRRAQQDEELLGRIKQHWTEGVSEDTEKENSWHGTMRDMLDEFQED